MKRVTLLCFFIIMAMLLTGCRSSNINNYEVYEKEYTAFSEQNESFVVRYAQIDTQDIND